MPRERKKSKSNSNKKTRQEKYNADNEIIIGVTTIKKEKRVDNKKSTRANHNSKKNSRTSKNNKLKHDIKNKEKTKRDSIYYLENDEFHKEEKIKKSNKKRFIISFIICLIIIISGLIFMMTTPKFYITDIEIEGNNKNSVDTYISLTKIDLNTTNIFAISKKSIIKNIKENSYVDSVEIKRKLPTTLLIKIKEREVAYQTKYNDKYIYLDKQGYVLEINEERDNTTKLIGLESISEEIREGYRLKNEDLIKLDTILKIINYCKYNSIENVITSIDISDKSNIVLNVDNGQKTVYLGDASNLSERMLWLKTILEKESKNKGEIFINGNMNESKVYFKPTAQK